MEHYHIWVDLRESHRDLEFARAVQRYLDALRDAGTLEKWQLTRRKLGFGPRELGEFHLILSFRDLAQLDQAFSRIAAREGELEELHGEVYGRVRDFRSALTRDFPDPQREDRA